MSDEPRAYRGVRRGPRAAVVLATRQGGAISLAQLRRVGLDDDRIDRLTAAGWMHREHRGVRRVGILTADGKLWAASLAIGPESAISHLAAGHEHAVLRGRRPAVIDVIAPTERRRRPGIRPHEARLADCDVVTRRGLRFTSLARTLLDLAATLPPRMLEVAVDAARHRGKLHLPSIAAVTARYPGHHGIGPLRRAVARHDPGKGMPRSELERVAARFLRERGFPEHRRNHEVRIDGEVFLPDVVWPEHRVVMEIDGRMHHDNDPAYAADRRRIRRFAAAGWDLVPVTAVDFRDRPDELAADLWSVLRAEGER